MACFLAHIHPDGTVELGVAGKIVEEEIRKTTEQRTNVSIDWYQIMPNHVHILFCLESSAHERRTNRFGHPVPSSISVIVGHIKAAVTRRLRARYKNSHLVVWQDSFHDHVIRNDKDLQRLRTYIANNPGQWVEDRYHPDQLANAKRIGKDYGV